MSSLLRDAIRDLLRPAVKQLAGVSVRYHSRIDGNVYPLDGGVITATLDDSGAEADIEDEGYVFTYKFKDFKIDVLDLAVMPQPKDTIEVVDGLGLTEQWFQVLPTSGDRAVEPLGNFEDTWRIHTKQVDSPDDPVIAYGNAAGDSYGSSAGDMHGGPRQ